MLRSSIATAVAAALVLVAASSLRAGSTGVTANERPGIRGYSRPVGLHHGFRIERVAPDSAAENDKLQPDDIIVKVDGEVIRSLDHLRAVLAEAYADDGDVTITLIHGASLAHDDIRCNVKKAAAGTVRGKRKPDRVDDDDLR